MSKPAPPQNTPPPPKVGDLPSAQTLMHAARLAISEDKPVLFDYWAPSIELDPTTNKSRAKIGVNSKQEKMLVKSKDEYTSVIQRNYKSNSELIVITENSIYLVSSQIASCRVDISHDA